MMMFALYITRLRDLQDWQNFPMPSFSRGFFLDFWVQNVKCIFSVCAKLFYQLWYLYYTTYIPETFTYLGPDHLELIIFDIISKEICNLPCRLWSVIDIWWRNFETGNSNWLLNKLLKKHSTEEKIFFSRITW